MAGIEPSPVVVAEGPQTRLTGADIQQPYEMLSRALDKTGDSLERVAVPLAERAGAQAVTRDDQGNVQVEHMPIFGLAGEAYSRAVKVAALAEADGKAERDDIALRQQFRDNPDGYVAAATSYKQKAVQDMTAVAGPEVGNAVGRAIDSKTTLTYRGLLNEKERLDLQRADNSIKAGMASAHDDALAMARGGADPNDPAFQGAISKYTALQQELLKNPRLAYTKDQADYEYAQFQGELAGSRYLYHIDQTYKDKGIRAAEDEAKDVLTNTAYKLSPSQRQSFYSHAIGEVRSNEAIRKQDVSSAQIAFRELKTAADLGSPVTPDEVESVRSAFKAANYPAGIAMVDAAFAHKQLNDAFGQQPINQQTSQLNAIRGATAARTAFQFFTGRGYRPEEAAGIVGNLVFESNINPAVMGDAGTSGGIAQFHNERLAALKQYADSQGKPWTDFQTQLEFIDKELKSSEGGSLVALRGARTPEDAAAAFAASYERPAGTDFTPRQALARSIFGGAPTDQSGGPGVQSWLIANRAHTLDNSAKQQWKQIWGDWSGGRGGAPPADRIKEVLDAARAAGDIDLQARIASDSDLMDKVERASTLPIAEQQAVAIELERRMRTGASPYAGAELVEKQLQARTKAIVDGLQNDPIATTVTNFGDKLKTPPPITNDVLANPDQLRANLAMRAQIAQAGAANWQVGALSALDKEDIANVKAALANPDPKVKAGIYGAIAALPDDVRTATLKKLGGNDVADMAEAAAGAMMSTNADLATSIFRGQQAMKADPRLNPEGEGNKAKFLPDLDKAMPATAFSLSGRTNPTGDYATAVALVKARYADLQAKAGQTDYSADTVAKAVNDVTGGVLRRNGGAFIAPARGMSQPQFDSVMAGLTDKDLAGVTSLNGKPITAAYLRGQAQLESYDQGRYLVNMARDPERPAYLYRFANTELPQKFILDLRNRPAAANLPFEPPSLAVQP